MVETANQSPFFVIGPKHAHGEKWGPFYNINIDFFKN